MSMTKQKFLEQLKKELTARNVSDADEIIADYEEHFRFKTEEGKSEEEIAAKLQSPAEIAEEYAGLTCSGREEYRGLKRFGVIAVSIPAALVYIFMWLTAVAVFCFAIASLALGVCLITTVNIAGLIPETSYFSALLCGIACFGMSILSGIGAFYIGLYIAHWGKMYLKKCSGFIRGVPYVSVSGQPVIAKKNSYRLKLIMIAAIIVFIAFLIIGYISMAVSAGSFEFWHVWLWFD